MNQTRTLVIAGVVTAVLTLGGCGSDAPRTASSTGPSPSAVSPSASATSAPVSDSTGGGHDLPDDFPLAAGWPSDDLAEPGRHYGLKGPDRDRPPLTFVACGKSAPDPERTDRLLAEWSNVEDFRARQVTTYDDSRSASAAVTAFVGFYRDCPTDEGSADDGYSTAIDVRRTDSGEESWAVVRASLYDGYPTVGLEVLHVVRVGRAVLIDTAANEGGAGPDRASDITGQIEYQAEHTRDVVEAMCAYADGGCIP